MIIMYIKNVCNKKMKDKFQKIEIYKIILLYFYFNPNLTYRGIY